MNSRVIDSVPVCRTMFTKPHERRPMKGIVLAGGIGSRLSPLTRVTNKHLLPVYDKPMIFYPLQILVDAGIRDILIVTGGHNAGDFLRLLQNGKEFGLQQLSFAYQEGEAGIADALRLAEPWAQRRQNLRGAGRQHYRRRHQGSGHASSRSWKRARW